jgi:hypothetical protein
MAVILKKIGNRNYAYLAVRQGGKVVHRYIGAADCSRAREMMAEYRAASAVPEHLHGLFWDADPWSLQLRRHSRYIIERILLLGGLDAAAWMQRAYPVRRILEVARTSRSLDEKSRGFWLLWFGADDA